MSEHNKEHKKQTSNARDLNAKRDPKGGGKDKPVFGGGGGTVTIPTTPPV